MTEADFQKQVVIYLTYALPPDWRFRAGMEGTNLGRFQRAQAKQLGRRRGWPDIELAQRGGAIRWIELKTATGRLSPEQIEFRDWVGTDKWALARTIEEVEAALVRFGITPRCAIGAANRHALGIAE